jgi:hypothetical protein
LVLPGRGDADVAPIDRQRSQQIASTARSSIQYPTR